MQNNKMTICLWFNDEAEEAANFYTQVFKNSAIYTISRFGKEGFEFHQKPEGTAMTVELRLNEMNFIALNGGPQFVFNEAVSIVVYCDTQEEIDYYWGALTKNGEESNCGWLKDKFGVSWQIIPSVLPIYLADKDSSKAQRVVAAFLKMKKFDIPLLKKAFEDK